MKILHVVQGYTPAIGGTEAVIQNLSERLTHRYGDEVTVFTTNTATNSKLFWSPREPTVPVGVENINGVTVRRFPVFSYLGHTRHLLSKFADRMKLPFRDRFRALFNGPIIFGMTQEIARFKADVVLASSFPFLHMHYALVGGQRSGKPVILFGALHTTDSWGFDRPMIYQAIKRAEAYVANSKFEKEYLINRTIPPAKITTIGVGIELEQFRNAEGYALRQRYGWNDAPVIAFVGHLARRKGIHHLIKAMPSVWQRYPQAKLLLAGADNNYTAQLEQEVSHFSTEAYPNRVIIKKNFSQEEKGGIFAACDVLVFPSSEESFGIVFLEAWACRKPVIGLRVGAIPSIVEDGVDGLLTTPGNTVELAQAICQLLANPEQRRQLGAAGYQKVKSNYTWDIVTAKFREIYVNYAHGTSQRNDSNNLSSIVRNG